MTSVSDQDPLRASASKFLDDGLSAYLAGLAVRQHDSEVLVAMETEAAAGRFPIVGRSVGTLLELLARMVGARRVMELGSGYGYSAYWFARAVGASGEVICSDGDASNAVRAEEHLRAAGLWDRVTFNAGDALSVLGATDGDFDVIYNDVDKWAYPECWRAARDRIRIGGLYVCDNTLWDGLVVTGEDRRGLDGWTAAIVEHNELIAADDRFLSAIVPLRDGVLVALRLS